MSTVDQEIEELVMLDRRKSEIQAATGERACKAEWQRLHGRQEELKQTIAVEFGHRRGWKLSRKVFSLSQLLARRPGRTPTDYGEGLPGVMDHPYYYRLGRRPAAIACHIYDWNVNEQEAREICNRRGMTYEVVRDFPSWWFPRHTQLVVFTPLRH
jgi:hypothetical protein